MAFYTLLHSGYMNEGEKKSSKRDMSQKKINFSFDGTKDPKLLHPVERRVLETCKGIINSETVDERKNAICSSLESFVEEYAQKHAGL